VTDIELLRRIQEEVCLCIIDETRRNLLNAGFQYLRVEYGAIRAGESGLVWRSVEWASAVLVRMTSALDNLVTAMGMISSILQHRANLERQKDRGEPDSRRRPF